MTFPTPRTISNDYTVLPSASTTLCISVKAGIIDSLISGTNTKSDKVGAYANKMNLLLLIKFRAGKFFAFFNFPQSELTDSSSMLYNFDKRLTAEIEEELAKAESVEALKEALDAIFIKRLYNSNQVSCVTQIIDKIIERNGNITMKELSSDFFYSERQIRRLFLLQAGVTPKMFSRIVRVNYALRLLQNYSSYHADVALRSGFFDQPHLIHDFNAILGMTPQTYINNMSDFYNDAFK